MDGELLLWFGSRSLALGRILGSTIRHQGMSTFYIDIGDNYQFEEWKE